MYYAGSGSNGLAVIVDARSKACKEIDGCLDLWGVGNRYLGKREWKNTLRIALRDYGTAPWSMAEVREHKAEVEALLRQAGIKAVGLLQSPLIPAVKTSHSAWNMFGRGGSPYKWGGTVWLEDGLWRCPLLNPQSYEYAYSWLFQRWFIQACEVAKGRMRPAPWPHIVYMPGQEMIDALLRLTQNDSNGPLSVDIETNTGGTIITAIGLSRDGAVVSVPWDGFKISGRDEYETGIENHPMGRVIQDLVLSILESDVPKVGHNFTFDVYQLQKRGYTVRGEIHDTLLMSRVAYPQYRRGLQQAAAIEFTVEPWKSFHKPPAPPKGAQDFDPWLATPTETRIYNGKDTWITALLFNALSKRIGL
jgi:hypothetical protein